MPRRPRHRPGPQPPSAGAARAPRAARVAPEAAGAGPHAPVHGQAGPGVGLAAIALGLVSAVAFWNSFRAALILDNIPIILQDPRLRAVDWRSIGNIFAHDYWWPSGDSNLYRPFTTLTYWLNHSVLGGGANPAGYHAVNLVLHWLNGVAVFVLVRGVTGRAWAALVAAAILVSHPLTVESVTNVVGRADLLAGLSIFGGLCLYRRFLGADRPGRARWAVGLGATCTLGLFSKESAVVLPALMLLHDVVFLPSAGPTRRATLRQSAGRAWPAYVSVVSGAALFLWARWLVLRDAPAIVQFGGDNPIVNASLWAGVMTAVKVAGYYLALCTWPARLSCDYSYDAITLFGGTLASGQDLHAWLAVAALVVLGAAAVVAWRRQPALTFLLGLAAIAFVPTSNLLFPIGTIMAERLMYVPLAGLAAAAVLMVVAAGERVRTTWPGAAPRVLAGLGTAAALIAVGALTVRTISRNEDWTSTARLWASAAEVVPESYKVHKALALAAMESDPSGGRVDEAIALASRSMAIIERADLPLDQQPAALYAEAGSYRLRRAQWLSGRGVGEAARDEIAQSLALLTRAEAIDREVNRLRRDRLLAAGVGPERVHDTGSAFIYRNLVVAYLGAGDPLRAIDAAEYLQRVSPGHFDPHYMRGVAEAAAAQYEEGRGRPREAASHLERAAINLVSATILNPAHRESWSLLAKVYQYVSPEPPAIIVNDGGGRLNRENPAVMRHVPEACAQLVTQLRAAGQEDEAAALRACR